jgi:uncharacterized protein (DUF849 family)
MSEPAPLIIEARVNETALRSANPHLPYAPAEIVEEAVRAWEAGASILHWHGRDPASGEPRNDVALYEEVARGVRERCDLILHPTLGYITQERPEDRLRHVEAIGAELAPVEFGSMNVDFWDEDAGRFASGDRVYVNRYDNVERVLRALADGPTRPTAVVWELGHVRAARRFAQMGLLPASSLWELVFSGDRMPSAAPVSLEALLGFRRELPPEAPWLVLCWNGDVLPLAAWAIPLGGHVAIGLGDHPHDRFGTPHHGDLVGRVAQLAETLGRPVSTPAQARRTLGLGGSG